MQDCIEIKTNTLILYIKMFLNKNSILPCFVIENHFHGPLLKSWVQGMVPTMLWVCLSFTGLL